MFRTQESGDTAILHTVFSTRRPCQRPSVNHRESAIVAAAVAAPSNAQGDSLPSADSAPATTITGMAGIGSPACSTRTLPNTNPMPYFASCAPRSIIGPPHSECPADPPHRRHGIPSRVDWPGGFCYKNASESNMPRLHRVLVIAGMHRSGTSLLASLAAAAGIDMGTRLMPGSKGNDRGHFEDLDFVGFHEACLARRGCGPLRPPGGGVPRLDPAEAEEAAALLAARARKATWGWKDPRTSLFLPAWDGLLADPFYLLVYRHPVEVALSLLRRGLDVEVQLDPWTAIRAWADHNRQLLAFRAARPGRCLLWSIAGATRDLAAALAAAEDRSGLPLAGRGLERHLAAGELRSGLLARDIGWTTLVPDAMELFARLEAAADLPGGETAADRDPGSFASARERDLEEVNEHLLAAALAAGPDRAEVAVPAPRRIDYSALKLQLARQAERSEQL